MKFLKRLLELDDEAGAPSAGRHLAKDLRVDICLRKCLDRVDGVCLEVLRRDDRAEDAEGR